MLDDKPSRASPLTHEVASITTLQGTGSVSVKLAEVNVKGLSFTSLEKLRCGPSNQVSIRFSLPGKSRLHFALIRLLPTVGHDATGYRYQAEFVRTEPQTVDHIVQCVSQPLPGMVRSTGAMSQQ